MVNMEKWWKMRWGAMESDTLSKCGKTGKNWEL